MAVVVGVHGIGQQGSTPERQLQMWSDALDIGLSAAGRSREVASDLAVPFYGWLFRKASPYLGAGEPEWVDCAETAFVEHALDEYVDVFAGAADTAAITPSPTLGPPGIVPPALLRGVASLDNRWGGGRALLLVGVLRQVYAYLYRKGAGALVRQIIMDQVTPKTQLLIGHSLGSVIAYDLILRGLVPQVNSLITLGSPLALGTVQRALDNDQGASNVALSSWSNIYDPWDIVTLGKGLAPLASDYVVDNGVADPHALARYLGRRETAALILAPPSGIPA